MMKAAVYYKFGEPIRIENIPRPSAITVAREIQQQQQQQQQKSVVSSSVTEDNDDGTVAVIKVMATGVCRSDWHGWKGHDNDIIQHGLPFVPGHEVSGIIVELANSSTSTSHKDDDNNNNNNNIQRHRRHIKMMIIIIIIIIIYRDIDVDKDGNYKLGIVLLYHLY